jgi:hypothetical protein
MQKKTIGGKKKRKTKTKKKKEKVKCITVCTVIYFSAQLKNKSNKSGRKKKNCCYSEKPTRFKVFYNNNTP